MNYLKKIFDHIWGFFAAMPGGRRLATLGTALLVMGALGGLLWWAGTTTYVPLMTNLSAEDSTNIIRILRDKHIPFRVDPTGKVVSIPPESLYEFRLELAAMGLPQTSVVGYELFDKQALGTTSLVQRINQKRAQEGELMRTINTIRGVRHSRVHLALPPRSTFSEDQKKSTASVVLDLETGTRLSEKQVYGIGNLVARAVEGLDAQDVMIVDSDGKVLSKNSLDALAALNASQLDYTEKVESDLEHRIQSLLAHVVGEGHVVAKVTADLDFSQINETQTLFDADGSAVHSVEKRSESMNGSRPGVNAAAGTTSNTPGRAGAAGGGNVQTTTTKNNEVTNYDNPQTIRRTQRSTGNIRRLSVAVVVDGKMTKVTDAQGFSSTKVEPWPADQLAEFEQIAAGAVGLDRKRGDSLDIKNIEFTREDFEEAQKLLSAQESRAHMEHLLTYGVIGMGILLFFFFVVRPFIKWVTENTIESVDAYLPQTIEELERLQKSTTLPTLEDSIPLLPDSLDPAKVQGEMVKEKIVTLVESNPHKAALILKDWLHGETKRRASEGSESNEGAVPQAASA